MFVYAEIRLSHVSDRAFVRCREERMAQEVVWSSGLTARKIGLICVCLLSV